MKKSLLSLAVLGAFVGAYVPFSRLPRFDKKARELAAGDIERIKAAEAKRARRANKRAGR